MTNRANLPQKGAPALQRNRGRCSNGRTTPHERSNKNRHPGGCSAGVGRLDRAVGTHGGRGASPPGARRQWRTGRRLQRDPATGEHLVGLDDPAAEIRVNLLPEGLFPLAEKLIEQARNRVRERVGIQRLARLGIPAPTSIQPELDLVLFASCGRQDLLHLESKVASDLRHQGDRTACFFWTCEQRSCSLNAYMQADFLPATVLNPGSGRGASWCAGRGLRRRPPTMP